MARDGLNSDVEYDNGRDTYKGHRNQNTIETLLQEERYFTTLDKILRHLSYSSPNCPSQIAASLDIKESQIYHFLSDLLSLKYVKLMTLDEDKYSDSKQVMNLIRKTDKNCDNIDHNSDMINEDKLDRKKEAWMDYFRELERIDYSTSLLCLITKEGKKFVTSLV